MRGLIIFIVTVRQQNVMCKRKESLHFCLWNKEVQRRNWNRRQSYDAYI